MKNVIRTFFKDIVEMPHRGLYPDGTHMKEGTVWDATRMEFWPEFRAKVPGRWHLPVPLWSYKNKLVEVKIHDLDEVYFVDITEQCVVGERGWFECSHSFLVPRFWGEREKRAFCEVLDRTVMGKNERNIADRLMAVLDTINGAQVLWFQGYLPEALTRYGWEGIKETPWKLLF